jgi:hypothetical protein
VSWRGQVDGALVAGFKRWVFVTGDGVDYRVGDAVPAGHAGVGPPFELGLPVGADGEDGDFEEPALDRGAVP